MTACTEPADRGFFPVPLPDLVVFDCDGVLVDSEIVICRVCAAHLSRLGHAVTAAAVAERFCGTADRSIREAVEERWGNPLPGDFWPGVRAEVARVYAAELRPITGIRAVLDGIATKRCVASGSDPKRLRLSLELSGLDGYFAGATFSVAEVACGKPAPDLFLHAAARMAVAPERAVVIEDSIAGIRAAVAAGMRPIGFTAGSHCTPALAEALLAAGATALATTAAELAALLRQPAV